MEDEIVLMPDVDISDWSKVDQGEERTMKYVMSVVSAFAFGGH